MPNKNPAADDDRPVAMMLRIVDLIDCIAANAPDASGRPVSMVTFAYLGELEQPLALSYEDSKLLVTKLLQSLSRHGNEAATEMLDRYFSGPHETDDDEDDQNGDDEDAGEAWKRPDGD